MGQIFRRAWNGRKNISMVRKSLHVCVKNIINPVPSLSLLRAILRNQPPQISTRDGSDAVVTLIWLFYPSCDNGLKFIVCSAFSQNAHSLAFCLSDDRNRQRSLIKIRRSDNDAMQLFANRNFTRGSILANGHELAYPIRAKRSYALGTSVIFRYLINDGFAGPVEDQSEKPIWNNPSGSERPSNKNSPVHFSSPRRA